MYWIKEKQAICPKCGKVLTCPYLEKVNVTFSLRNIR